ncbi:MAG: VOC family protein, partial [bacterium]
MHTQPTTDGTPGIHHLTAIAGDPQKNIDFYTRTLGLRLVKRTVNFDDPGSYHLYFGNELGTPGTILTFFLHPGARPGLQGVGYQTATAFAIPTGSLPSWAKRLGDMGVRVIERDTRFGQPLIRFADHDGMQLELIETPQADRLLGWKDGPVGQEIAVRGFHSATLTLGELQETADVLQTLGFTQRQTDGSRTRFIAQPTASTHPSDPIANIIDIVVDPDGQPGRLGPGVVHHHALRASDAAQQARYYARLSA